MSETETKPEPDPKQFSVKTNIWKGVQSFLLTVGAGLLSALVVDPELVKQAVESSGVGPELALPLAGLITALVRMLVNYRKQNKPATPQG